MIHCCQSRDPLLQTHSANPFLSTGTCINRTQFSFSVQVQFSSIRKLFFIRTKSCMSFVIYPYDSLKTFPRFHSWHLWLQNLFFEVEIIFQRFKLAGLNRARPLFWAAGRHVVQCEPVIAGQVGTSGPLEWARCSLAGWLHFTMVSLNNMNIKLE